MSQRRGKAKRSRRAKPKIKGVDASRWDDFDLLNLATMHAACVAEQIGDTCERPDFVNGSIGAAMLANAMFQHSVDPEEVARLKFKGFDFRKLAHKVLDMHLDRTAMINLETEGMA